jgi:hypothetical protein
MRCVSDGLGSRVLFAVLSGQLADGVGSKS